MRAFYRIMPTVFLVCMSILALSFQQVKAEDNLVLEMNVDKTTVTIGEEINITLTLKNVGETNVTITYGPPLFDVKYCTTEWCFRWSTGKVFVLWIRQLILEPGENYSQTLKWNLYKYVGGEYHPPKPGTYQLLGMCGQAGIVPGTGAPSIAVTLMGLPVGGYTFLIKEHITTKPLGPYLALIGFLLAGFTVAKRKIARAQ